MKIRVTKNRTIKRSGNWEKVEISLESDEVSSLNLIAIKEQIARLVDRFLNEEMRK